jgi:RNA polymerase sigma factor (sigma-70 family)
MNHSPKVAEPVLGRTAMTTPHLPPVLHHIRKLMGDRPEGLSDAELLHCYLCQRDEAAFELLLQRHAPMVLASCRRLLNDPADVEDAFQATFLVLARHGHSVRRPELLGCWLYGVAYRIALKARSKAALRHRREKEAARMPSPVPDAETLPDLRPVLDEELQRLPAKYRTPIVLCYLQGKTNEEVARHLRCPAGTVKTRLARARELLRGRLTRRGLALSAAGMATALSTQAALATVPACLLHSACATALRGASGQMTTMSASVAGLAEAMGRTLLWSRAKAVLAACLVALAIMGGVGWLGYHSRTPRPADELAEAAVPPVALPADGTTMVLSWDQEQSDLPRRGEEPRLAVRSDGLVCVRDPYGADEPATARLSGPQLQRLMHQVVHVNGFFKLAEGQLRDLGPAAITTALHVHADGQERSIRCPQPSRFAAASASAGQLAAIEQCLERLARWVQAGGDAGVTAALTAANQKLQLEYPEAPLFAAGDLQLVARRSGSIELAFERRQIHAANPFSFVYARIEQAPAGEPLVTVKADLVTAAEPARTAPPEKSPARIQDDPNVKYDYPIVYVRTPRDPDELKDFHFYFWQIPSTFNAFSMKPGGDLVILYPDGREEVLVPGGDGSVADPAVSFDGEWVYYAYVYNQKEAYLAAKKTGNYPVFRDFKNRKLGADVFKVHVKTKKIVQLTKTAFTPNTGIATWTDSADPKSPPYAAYNMGPCPVPGGKVVFTSNRNALHTPKNINPLDSVTQLFIMDEDGSNVEQIGHLNLGGALHPAILKDGRVIFSSAEHQGLRGRHYGPRHLWGIWAIHPDGTQWEPIISAFNSGEAFHFVTQLADERIVVERYYVHAPSGFGPYLVMPASPPKGMPAFVDKPAAPILSKYPDHGLHMFSGFIPYGVRNIPDGFWGTGDSTPVGKLAYPAAAPDNHLLTVYGSDPKDFNNGASGGPSGSIAPVPFEVGIYLLKGGKPHQKATELLLIKNDPKYMALFPKALVPYQRIYGVAEPKLLPLKNDGKKSKHLPEGTPFGIVGTSSLHNRQSAPSYPQGNGRPGGMDKYLHPVGLDVNWDFQGADAGLYGDSDIWGIRIVLQEGTTDSVPGPHSAHLDYRFYNHANERLRILGEFPVRKFKNGVQPVDGDGNPDTSFTSLIPANVSWTFQTLDNNGMVLNMAQTWHQVRPGEVRHDCGGCHAHTHKPTRFEATAAARDDYTPWDLTGKRTPLFAFRSQDESRQQWDTANRTGVRFVQGIKNVEFYRDVKPILEKSCTACHSGKLEKPAGGLVLDNYGPTNEKLFGYSVKNIPQTYSNLADPTALHTGWKKGTRTIWSMQSRRSPLIWKIFGKRLDGFQNDEFVVPVGPLGRDIDPRTKTVLDQGQVVPYDQKKHQNKLGWVYSGSIMPPPEAVQSGKVKPLSDEDKLTLVRWIDLGCPIDFDYDPKNPDERGRGWMGDDQRPTLTLTYPDPGVNEGLSRLLIGMHDAYSGLEMSSFQVTADFAVDGTPAGENLAAKFRPTDPGIWELKLAQPLAALAKGKLTVSIKDKQGNVTRIERTFSVRRQPGS